MMGKTNGVGLSKNLLQMKFMQKCKAKYEDKPNEQKISIDSVLNECVKLESNKYLIESSFVTFENLKFGRMSFKGMNVEIERLLNDKYNDKAKDEEEKNDEDVSSIKMAKRYSKYIYNHDIDRHSNNHSHGLRKKFKNYQRPVDWRFIINNLRQTFLVKIENKNI